MEPKTSDLTYIIENYGVMGLLGIVVLILLINIVKSKWFGAMISRVSDKFIEKFIKSKTKGISIKISITNSDIINHDIFNYIDFWTYSKIPTIQFSTDYRTAVFRKYLTIYLKSYKSKIFDFVSSGEYQTMDSPQVCKAMLNLINEIVFDYEKKMEDAGIPKIVIEKMKTKNNETIALTMDLIDSICNSPFYNCDKNFLKIYSILNIVLSILENTISCSEGICNSINGKLKGLKFDGKIEP